MGESKTAHAKNTTAARSKPASTRHRSRAGCLTCKQKHVKCDETRPSCRKCTQKGLTCGGYSKGFKWSYKHQPNTVDTPFTFFEPPGKNVVEIAESTTEDDASQKEPSDTDPIPVDNSFSPSTLLPFDALDDGDRQYLDNEFPLTLPDPSQTATWFPDDSMALELTRSPNSRTSTASRASWEGEHMSLNGLELAHQILRAPSLTSPDTTLSLINNWFDQVCPAWSAFDSGMNLNRKLAADLWHSSAAVFNSLQSMSASFLSARLPQMRRPALSLLRTATVCIQAEANAVRSKPRLDSMPTGLLFSLFCLGTSVCWLDSSRVGVPFLKEAKALLQRLSQQNLTIAGDQLEIFSFFKKSLVYWEMLLSVVEDEDLRSEGEPPPRILPSNDPGETSTDLLPHPWTGISTLTSDLFARSIRLCRTYRRRITKPTGRAISLSTAMQEIQDAQKLEEQLLELDFTSITQMNETGDQKTPWLHLACIAEAYQLASLLQLYVTFPDLVSLRLPMESGFPWEGHVPWDKWIIPLTLQLIKVLEQIPPDSGSRVIQPLLYICASTGLRYNLSATSQRPPESAEETGTSGRPGPDNRNGLDILDYINQIDSKEPEESASEPVPQIALEIANGRNFIVRRLNILESTLQPKPIIVAKELVKAIWAAYDDEPPGSTSIHWLDVMEARDLRSLFG